MKYGDMVKVVKNKKNYLDAGVKVGMVGMLTDPEIRNNEFMVVFSCSNTKDDEDIYIPIKVEDLEVETFGAYTDEMILKDLPKNNPKWWCKVEDGYIMNLLGEKKNKIPYDYNS